MDKNGPIIIIEDDLDDLDLLREIFNTLEYQNEIVFFDDGFKALSYLSLPGVNPFLILADINMPRLNGFQLRNRIFSDKALNMKCAPYLFFTTAGDKTTVDTAYALSVQGFFKKPRTIEDMKITIKIIVDYWKVCISPNEYQ